MARKKKSKKENSGGVNIKGKSVSIGGDVIGGDKNVNDSGLTASDLKWITEKFQ
jgi:hypothetical protein